jgi:Tetracyclin repressor-like, C-terminal domain
MSVSERLAALFTAAGFPGPSGAIDALLSYVIGMSSTEAAWLTAVARSGETEAAFVARLLPAARQAAGYDHLAWAHQTPPGADPAQVRDTKFANGLDIVLDGLATRVPRAGDRS